MSEDKELIFDIDLKTGEMTSTVTGAAGQECNQLMEPYYAALGTREKAYKETADMRKVPQKQADEARERQR